MLIAGDLAVAPLTDILGNPRLFHRMEVHGGVLAAESLAIMQHFFDDRR